MSLYQVAAGNSDQAEGYRFFWVQKSPVAIHAIAFR